MKKYILMSVISAFGFTAFGAEVIKECNFTVRVPGESKVIPTLIMIIEDQGKLFAKINQTIDGKSIDLPEEIVTQGQFQIRKDLDRNSQGKNLGEQLVSSTESFLKRSGLASAFPIPVDFNAIRSAKVYQVGKVSPRGGTAIVEAKDEYGNDLGSFVAGFFPFMCEEELIPR